MARDGSRWTAHPKRFGNLDTIVVQPAGLTVASRLAIFCHGFGAPGNDLVGIAEALIQSLSAKDIRPVMAFPAAPIDLADEGMGGGRAWWRINMARLLSATAKEAILELRELTPPGMQEAKQELVTAIQKLMQEYDVNESQLLLGGFSQGAMLAVDTALDSPLAPPAGLAIFSGALLREKVWESKATRLRDTAIYQSHGRLDNILTFGTGEALHDMLVRTGCQVHWDAFDGPHTIPQSAIQGTSKLFEKIATIDEK